MRQNATRWMAGIVGLLLVSSCAPRSVERPPAAGPQPTVGKAAALPLPNRLPADTLFYGRLELSKMLAVMKSYLRFVDPDLAESVATQARSAWDSLLRIAANRDFKPRLAERLFESSIHLVGLKQAAEPAATGGEPSEGRGQPESTDVINLSLIVECGAGPARDLLEQIKTQLKRLAEKNPELDVATWTRVEIEPGELIRIEPLRSTVGWIDEFFVVSDEIPRRLWSVIQSPAENGLADTERFGHFSHGDPIGFVVFDLKEVVAELVRTVESVERGLVQHAPGPDSRQARMEREAAHSRMEDFRSLLRLLSLDKLRSLGARLDFRRGDDSIWSCLTVGLHHDEPISRVLAKLFDGGARFRLPAAGMSAGLSMMWRLGIAEIYQELLEQMPAEARRSVLTATAMVSNATGYSIQQLVQLLSGDLYLFFDLGEAEAGLGRPPGPDSASKTRPATSLDAGISILFGIRDYQATHRALGRIYEVLSGMPMFSSVLHRLSYQGLDVYLIGPPAAEGEPDLESEQVVALSVLDRHLAFGKWKQVTDLIRRTKTTASTSGGVLTDVLQRHPDASLLIVISRSLMRQLRGLQTAGLDGQSSFDRLADRLRQLDLPADGDPDAEPLRRAVIKLFEQLHASSEMSADFPEPAFVIRARHSGQAFRLVFESEMRRR